MLSFESYDEEKKRDLAFQSVIAMRDTMAIAKKIGYKPTYESAIQHFYDFSPELYEEVVTSIKQRNISDEAKVYIAQAKVKSMEQQQEVSALDELKDDIKKFESFLGKENISNEDKELFSAKIGSLKRLEKSLKPRKISENRILQRDFNKADRKDFGAEFIEGDDFFVDYKLRDDKYLRLRLLHPDTPEHITGADLVYEQHDVKNKLIRVMFLQYKIWENGVLYFSKAKNLTAQIKRLKECLCSQNYCASPVVDEKDRHLAGYRFPHCCAFLRPTDKLQQQNEKLVSSGIHIPICAVERIKEIEGDKIDRKYLRHQTLNQDIFEHLYNRGFIGSRWLKQQDLENFYKEHKILESGESIIFYAREIKE